MAPYIWTLQYPYLCPENCFVLDDGQGRAVGYVIGCSDVTGAFAQNYHKYVDEVLMGGQGASDVPVPQQLDTSVSWTVKDPLTGKDVVNPEALSQLAHSVRFLVLDGVQGKKEMAHTYRATLHINLLDGYRTQGWGAKMIEKLVESVRTVGKPANVGDSVEPSYGKGIHIGVSGENKNVVPFYEKMGFKVHEGGERVGNVWMLRDMD
jgi:GNAT superfamily N-acetyltransferase